MNDVTRVLQILKKEKSERFALATVIGIEGSAYRHEGAKMLIDEKGNHYGIISGGCLEEDLVHQARDVLQSRKAKIVTYDLKSENDMGWGQGIGCNGMIDVYIEEVGWDFLKKKNGQSLWAVIEQKLLSGQKVAAAKMIDEGNNPKGEIYYCEDGEILHCSNEQMKPLLNYLETFFFRKKKTEFIIIENQGRILTELYKPKEILYIFGAGQDTEPLVELASKLDFSVRLIDPRSERFDNGNFSTADEIFIEFPHIFLQHTDLPLNSFVVIMTHNFHWDQLILKHFINKPPHYLGILGPKRRTERLLNLEPIPEWIHSPIGVEIFAEGPEEIAISIGAELIKRRNGFKRNDTKLSVEFS